MTDGVLSRKELEQLEFWDSKEGKITFRHLYVIADSSVHESGWKYLKIYATDFDDNGILDGTFYEALNYICGGYTDMVHKFFRAVYLYVTKHVEVKVYREYNEEEITKWYNTSSWAQRDYATLEECLKDYVGKPDMSLPQFKTVFDIINWFYQLREIYARMCKTDINKILEIIEKRGKYQ